VQSIVLGGDRLTVRLRRDARVSVERLVELVGKSAGASFSPSGVLSLPAASGNALERARATLEFLAAEMPGTAEERRVH